MSADPFVPDPMNGQAWNRYSYVINNALALTDTNGYCFLGMCSWGKAISTFFNRTFGVLFKEAPEALQWNDGNKKTQITHVFISSRLFGLDEMLDVLLDDCGSGAARFYHSFPLMSEGKAKLGISRKGGS